MTYAGKFRYQFAFICFHISHILPCVSIIPYRMCLVLGLRFFTLSYLGGGVRIRPPNVSPLLFSNAFTS